MRRCDKRCSTLPTISPASKQHTPTRPSKVTFSSATSSHGDALGGSAAGSGAPAAPGPRKRLKKKRKAKRGVSSTSTAAAVTQQANSQLKAFSSAQDKPLPWVSSQYAGRSHSVLANAQITMSDPSAVGVKGKVVRPPPAGRSSVQGAASEQPPTQGQRGGKLADGDMQSK